MNKTIREHISSIHTISSNLEYIAKTGNINGSLLLSIEKIMQDYAHSQTQELVEMVKYLYNFSKGRHFHSGSVTDRTVTELLAKYEKS